MEAGGVVMKMFVAEGAAAFQSRGKLLHQLKRATAAAGAEWRPLRLRMTPPCQDASKVAGERGY